MACISEGGFERANTRLCHWFQQLTSISSSWVQTFAFSSRTFIICARPHLYFTSLYSPRHHFPRLVLADISPRRCRVVRENRKPLLGDRLRVIFLLAVDRLQGIQVEAHAPGEIDVRRGGD